MKIKSLLISNFRGIKKIEVENLGDTIIIAGQNGSGKSCIFDAIRLLKSTYGGYQQNEYQHFFGEFQIQLHGGPKHLKGLFNKPGEPLEIEVLFHLREEEKQYIAKNAEELLEETIWQILLPEAFQFGGYQKALFSNQFRERQPEVTEKVKNLLPILNRELRAPHLTGRIEVSPEGQIKINKSEVLPVIFSNYRPRHIGVIDYHGAQRHYGRENVQGINLSLEQKNQQYSQHTLYNYNNKYNNVKSEMAGNFVKELLIEKAGAKDETSATLVDTLKELFESFFPDKKFLGPQPTAEGSLSFPVRTLSGNEHDLDELSSGEKEILYGYLRIRSSAPKESIILLDEPELHLNPRLIRGLPEFYRKHLGESLQNQLWLVTHSDALIREAVGKPGFNVFHMLPCGSDLQGGSQLKPLTATKDLDIAIADLVGDLASYRPGGKGLIFEGGGDTDFDKTFCSTLFAEELRGLNLISGSNKMRVRALHEILDRAYDRGELPTKFFAIVDKDSEPPIDTGKAVSWFQWKVYHIENYLLDNEIIAEVLNTLKMKKDMTPEKVEQSLLGAARKVVKDVVAHRVRIYANNLFLNCINFGYDPKEEDVGKCLANAAIRSAKKIQTELENQLSEEKLTDYERAVSAEIEKSFSCGDWKDILPGRGILKQFMHSEDISVPYEVFRNLIVGKMADRGRKPQGMKDIIDKVTSG